MHSHPIRLYNRFLGYILLGLLMMTRVQAATPAIATDALTIYTYDSFLSKSGPGSVLKTEFEKNHPECPLHFQTFGDAVQIVNRLETEKDLKADLLLGIDQLTWPSARSFAQSDQGFTPYDHGPLTWMMDEKQLKDLKLSPPQTLNDLLKSEWKKKFILEDPRTSTPGLVFLLYTHQKFKGEAFTRFWRALSQQWLLMAPGWDTAYSVFLSGKAPLVWSYLTSEAYHRSQASQGDAKETDSSRYRALILEGEAPEQKEGIVRTKKLSARSPDLNQCASHLVHYILTDSAQLVIAERNWMFPVKSSVKLKPYFQALPKVKNRIDLKYSREEIRAILKLWSRAIRLG